MSATTTTRRLGLGATALVAGGLFGFGLALAGMTRPERVRGFLDFSVRWDPTLVLVLGAALAVHAAAYRLVARRAAPVFAGSFSLPTRRDLDLRLLGGAAIFGVGWGLGGFCPGPAIVSLVGGHGATVAFVLAMIGGLALATPRR